MGSGTSEGTGVGLDEGAGVVAGVAHLVRGHGDDGEREGLGPQIAGGAEVLGAAADVEDQLLLDVRVLGLALLEARAVGQRTVKSGSYELPTFRSQACNLRVQAWRRRNFAHQAPFLTSRLDSSPAETFGGVVDELVFRGGVLRSRVRRAAVVVEFALVVHS